MGRGGIPGTCPGGGGKVSGIGGGPDDAALDAGPRLKKFVWLFSSVGGSGSAERGTQKTELIYYIVTYFVPKGIFWNKDRNYVQFN